MNRLQEILQRKAEIRTQLQGNEDVDLKALQEEIRELTKEQEQLEERQRIADDINDGGIEAREIPKPKDQRPNGGQVNLRSMNWESALESKEYRSAWAKEMMGQSLSVEEREFVDRVNDEYRAFTHTTENSAILVPKTVTDGIWKRAEEVSTLWADIRKLFVRGELTLLKGEKSADAKWYDELTTVDTDELAFGQLNLTGCELAKAVQVTWKLKKMALPQFEAYIQREIGDRMGSSLGYGAYQGRGKPGAEDTFKAEPLGIKTALLAEAGMPQVVEYTDAPTYRNFTAAMGILHSAYAAGAKIYARSTTIWNEIANLTDANARPYFVADVSAGGVGRIFGLPVQPDAAIPEGEILIGNLNAGYVANINEDITMYMEDHIRQRLTDYMGYAIVDGGPQDNAAFVVMRKAPEAPAV